MIKKFNTKTDYSLEGYPTIESRVSLIRENGEIAIDGVNVEVKHPECGDAVYKKDGKVHYFKGGDALNHTALIGLGYEDLGQVWGWKDGHIGSLDKAIQSSTKFLDICQYAITAIASTTIQVKLRMSPDYAVDTVIDIELTDTNISQENANIISAAVEAKAAEVGDTKDWWAYLDDDRIVIQCDTCVDSHFYQCSATGCTIKHITWDDMPESSSYYKSNGRLNNYRGILNRARGIIYFTTNGRDTADANDVWHGAIGANATPLKPSVFYTTAMYGNGEHQYPTYEDYIRGEFRVMWPQKYGCFNLPSGKELTAKYGNATAPTKNGGTKYKFPALHFPCTLDRGVDGMRLGDFYLTGVDEGVAFMEDVNMAKINATRRKMGHTLISNGSYRWFAQRCDVYGGWLFRGSSGSLYGSYVYYGYGVQGAVLLKP